MKSLVEKQAKAYTMPKADKAEKVAALLVRKSRCYTCAYWDHKGENKTGRCKATSPQVSGSEKGIWPWTGPDEWCGEHPQFHEDL